jgi:hypothetical protein
MAIREGEQQSRWPGVEIPYQLREPPCQE